MPLKTLVVIALRLYAIYWLIQGLSELITLLPMWTLVRSQIGGIAETYVYVFPSSMLVISIVLWALSAKLSAQVTKGHDTQLVFTSLTREDLYRFAFVFLGLFFVLSSLFSLIQTGYQFFAFDVTRPDSNPHKGEFLWPFLGHGFTLIAGFSCMLGARKWTNKLIRLENKHEAPPPAV
jgi:hypothetical protein